MFYEVVIEKSETPNKCTIAPLSNRHDFKLIEIKGPGVFGPLKANVLLHHEGKCLTSFADSKNAIQGIAAIDCVWRRLDQHMTRLTGVLPELARIPEGFVTAYPRKSFHDLDPTDGLATIEAIFIASAMLGNWDVSLLSEYYFGSEFIKLNEKRFCELGLLQVLDKDSLPNFNRQRNSQQRRRDRGRPY